MEKFYIVAKSDSGWKSIVGIAYESIDEARAAIDRLKRKGNSTIDFQISKSFPAYVGCGFSNLNYSDIID